ncbi:MAG: DNA repair protein RadA [Candidatus Magasanikbacteria bacterium]|jgi:DNA repair protein RadA/Sms|nr:DNA repair protein RadA [Candidatus Magasanikbacteria bacterium]MBT4071686.1 DNA repair protein RadA [Candidatus Magasanikbacteria bacterium]
MGKQKTIFTCSHCTAQYQKWGGRCLECGKWGTIEEEFTSKKDQEEKNLPQVQAKTIKITDIPQASTTRISSGIEELDRVLGGGIIPGSFILLGGEPGIGKSTLALQMSMMIDRTLYISGEESAGQIMLRANRLVKKNETLELSNDIVMEHITATIRAKKPPIAIVDSIQTVYSQEVDGSSGSMGQVRACATKLLTCAKETGTTIILIGHVTKDGDVAGPRTLEHLVDTVLYLEGDRYHNLRMLRAVKNRFGSTYEIGMFDMKETGLQEVPNPSEILLAERGDNMSGSVVTCLMEGTRPILVEVQALVNKTSFGYPVRKASGFDLNRLHVLIAVLEKRSGIPLGQYDVHVNIVGGMKATEPAADLAICIAIVSAFLDTPLGNETMVFGEVGLGGEVRSTRFLERRIKEAKNFGMTRVMTKTTKEITESDIQILHGKHIKTFIDVMR